MRATQWVQRRVFMGSTKKFEEVYSYRLYFWYYIFIGYVFALLFVIDLLRSGWYFIYHNETDKPNQTQFSLLYTFRVGVKGLRFVNHESISWSHEPKISKTSIFQELFFLKYDNFKIIGTDDIVLSICLELKEWGWTMQEQNSVNYFVKH